VASTTTSGSTATDEVNKAAALTAQC